MSFSSIYTSYIPNQKCAICFGLANESGRYAVHIPDSVDPQKIPDVAQYHFLHLSCMEEHLQKSVNKSCIFPMQNAGFLHVVSRHLLHV